VFTPRCDAGQLQAGVDLQPLGVRAGAKALRHLQRLAEELPRLDRRVEPCGTVAGPNTVGDRLGGIVASRIVVGEDRRLIVELVGVQLLDGSADSAVELAAPPLEQGVIGDVLDDRMLEDELQLGDESRLVDEFMVLQDPEVALHPRGRLRDPSQQLQAEFAADDGGGLDRALHGLIQAVDPGPDDVLHSPRQLDPRRPRRPPAFARTRENAALGEGVRDFLDEQRVPLGLAHDPANDLGRDVARPEQRAYHGCRLGLGEHVEVQLGEVGLVGPADRVAGSVGGYEEHGQAGQALDQERAVVLGRLVDPVDVLDDQYERPALHACHRERAEGLERLLAFLPGVEVLDGPGFGLETQQLLEEGPDPLEGRIELVKPVAELSSICNTWSPSSIWKLDFKISRSGKYGVVEA
jgi:hypothetical protein